MRLRYFSKASLSEAVADPRFFGNGVVGDGFQPIYYAKHYSVEFILDTLNMGQLTM